jgi:hypothetical protein
MSPLDLSSLPALDDLSGDLIETLEDHADSLLDLGITPNTTAEMIGSLADDLLDFEALLGGPWGVALEAIDGKAISKGIAIGQAIVSKLMAPEARTERKANREQRRADRQARRAARRS